MTCIIAFKQDDKLFFGGDSASIASDMGHFSSAHPKVFRHRSGILMGYTASFRLGQLLEHSFDAPPRDDQQSAHGYLCTRFASSLKTLAEGENLWDQNPSNRSGWGGGVAILGFEGEIYVVGSDWQITCPAEGYAAVGSGSRIATGALAVTPSLKGKNRSRVVLDAAQRHNAGVRGPFHTISGDGKLKKPKIVAKLGKNYLQP